MITKIKIIIKLNFIEKNENDRIVVGNTVFY